MISGVQVVSESEQGVIASLFRAIAGVMVSRFSVMTGGMSAVLRRLAMMVDGLLGHQF